MGWRSGEPHQRRFFRLVAVVPRNRVSGTAREAPPLTAPRGTATPAQPFAAQPSTARRHEIHLAADATAADFLNRKADYLDTIVQLQEAMSEEGQPLERQSLKPEDFYDSIGNIEERAEAAFKALAKQIDDDNLLSELLEREELRPALKKTHAESWSR